MDTVAPVEIEFGTFDFYVALFRRSAWLDRTGHYHELIVGQVEVIADSGYPGPDAARVERIRNVLAAAEQVHAETRAAR